MTKKTLWKNLPRWRSAKNEKASSCYSQLSRPVVLEGWEAGMEGSETFKKAGRGGWVCRQNKLMERAREESEKS